MQIRRTPLAVGAALALVVTATGAGCGVGGTGSASRGTDCVWDMRGPTVTGSEYHWTMVGNVTVTCVEEPKAFDYQLALQWRSTGAAWQNEDVFASDHELPPPRGIVAAHHCRVGDWRLHWQATGVGPDGVPGSSTDSSQEVYIHTCP
jgi:hypothetical protein